MTLSWPLGVPPGSALRHPLQKGPLHPRFRGQQQLEGHLPARDGQPGVWQHGQIQAWPELTRLALPRSILAAAVGHQTLAQHLAILPRSTLCHLLRVPDKSFYSRTRQQGHFSAHDERPGWRMRAWPGSTGGFNLGPELFTTRHCHAPQPPLATLFCTA